MWTCFTCFLRLKLKDILKFRMVDLFEITIAHVLNWASAQTSQRNCFAGPFLNNSPRIALTCYSISASIAVFLSISLFYTTLYSNPPKHCENTQLIVPFRSKTTVSVVLVTKNNPNIFPIYRYIIIIIIIIIFHIYIIDIHHVFRRLATVLVCVFGMPKLAFVADSRAMSPHRNNLCWLRLMKPSRSWSIHGYGQNPAPLYFTAK
jgi:hypothetical protein